MMELDRWLFRCLHDLRSHESFVPGLQPCLWFFSHEALDFFLYAFLVLAMFRVLRRRALDGLLLYFLSGQAIEVWVKPHFSRPRPSFDVALHGLVHVLGRAPPATSFSFPSGSAFVAAASATWMVKEFAPQTACIVWLRRLAVLFAFLIGISRVIAGLHYPSDIVVGWLTGVLFTLALRRFMQLSETSTATHS